MTPYLKKYFKIILLFLILLSSCVSKQYSGRNIMQDRDGLKFLYMKIEDKWVFMLVDTGAKSTILDYNFCKQNNITIRQTSEDLIGIGGETTVWRSNPVNMMLSNSNFKINPLVANLNTIIHSFRNVNVSVVGIIGADFLKRNGCVINYKNNTLICGDEKDK